MKNLLITGGSGFIGSHLCLILLKNNYSLYVLDSFVNSSHEALNRVKALAQLDKKNVDKNLKVFVGDMRDKNSIDNVFRFAFENNKSIEGVIHLASLKSVKESIDKPIDYLGNNIISTLNLSSL